MSYRVIQWTTGNVGAYALSGIINHAELELVGLFAHSQDKQGRDAGDLCAYQKPTGVLATSDIDGLLALKPDCICYTTNHNFNPGYVDDMCRMLEAGINVVSSANPSLNYPAAPLNKDIVERLEQACQRGQTTLMTSGIDPGASGDIFPIALAGLSERVDSIRITEMMNYAGYPDPDYTGWAFGFARPMDFKPPLAKKNALIATWGAMTYLMADAMGVEVEEIREVYERSEATEPLETLMGNVEPGQCDGVHFQLQGIVNGEPLIITEHVNRLRPTTEHDDWPTMSDGSDTGYRIEIKGQPNFLMEINMEAESGNHTDAGTMASAMRIVNAIPAVCASTPGVKSVLDLPLFAAHGRSGKRAS